MRYTTSDVLPNLLRGISFIILAKPDLPKIFFVNSVSITPGLTELTNILFFARSNANVLVKPLTACLVDE